MISLTDIICFQIAGFNFSINFHETEWTYIKDKLKKEVLLYLKDFLINKPQKIDYSINIIGGKKMNYIYTKKDKRYYLELYQYQGKKKIISYYRISIKEFQMILMSIFLELLKKYKGFVVHTSACRVDNYVYIFPGRPQIGKSTIVNLLKRKYPILADDIGIIRKIDKKYFFYQTPFLEKNSDWFSKDMIGYPIAKVFFLEKANFFKTVKLNNRTAIFNKMLSQFRYQEVILNLQEDNISEFVGNFKSFNSLFFAKRKGGLWKII